MKHGKKFFLRTVRDISILDEEYGIPYEPIPDYDPSNLLQESVFQKHFGYRHYVDWIHEEALNIFAGAGKLDLVKLMVTKGANPSYGLVSAVKNNHIDIVKYIISQRIDEDDLEDALNKAGKYGNLKMVEYLVSQGANDFGRLLFTGMKYSQKNIVKYAYDKGVNEIEITTALEGIDDPVMVDYLKTLSGR